jgi:diguanylate cyclase (GGDEF)-like protein/PAS domain S-box-containing protein
MAVPSPRLSAAPDASASTDPATEPTRACAPPGRVAGVDDSAAESDLDPGVLQTLMTVAAQTGSPQLGLVAGSAGRLRIAWANDSGLELFGLDAGELLGRELPTQETPRQPAEDGCQQPSDWSVVATAALQDPTRWRPATMRGQEGTLVNVRIRVTPAGAAGWVVTMTPVTDAEAAAELARVESEHRFRALADHAPVGIVVSEAGLRLGFVNDRFAELAGVDGTRLLGNRWLDVIHPKDLPNLHESLREVLSGTSAECTVRLLTIGQDPRWVQFRFAAVTTPRRAAGFIGTAEDITTRRAWEAQLAYQASHDPLTGLANRRRLIETLSDLLDSRRTRDRDFALLFCDLDGFKQVNDTLGHDTGDRVLIEVGRRLSTSARDHDLVARIAGDEFVIVLGQIRDAGQAQAAAGRYLAVMSTPVHVGGRTIAVAASIGVALPEPHDTADSLLRAADQGMYQAKAAGAGGYRLTPPRTTAAQP